MRGQLAVTESTPPTELTQEERNVMARWTHTARRTARLAPRAALAAVLALSAGCGAGIPDAPPREYRAAVAELERFIGREMEAKRLPALSIALVDDHVRHCVMGADASNQEEMRAELMTALTRMVGRR